MKILKFKPYPADRGPSALQGTFTLQVPQWHNVIIEEMSLFQKGTNRWVAFPSRAYQSQDGAKKYFHYARFEEQQTMRDFSHAVCKALDAYLAAQSPSVYAQPAAQPQPKPVQTTLLPEPEADDGLPF